jgi:very-short-patch-repair endonuclease
VSELHLPVGHPTSLTPLALLLERQDRVVSTGQFEALGISSKVITRMRREGWLHHKHRGVWVVGSPKLTPFGAFWAGHLATGGVISHRSAAVVHQMRVSYWKVELTFQHYKPDRDLIKLHVRKLRDEDVLDLDGLPVTTVERTLLDLADVLNPRQLEIAINQAETHDKLDHRKLQALLLNANGRRGVRPLNDALQAHALGLTLTESQLEEEFLRLIRRYRFAQPRTQVHILGWRCDFAWPEQRIVIETDGARFHKTRERDARKDRELRRAGWTVDRLSYREVFFRPAECARILEGNGVPRPGC